MSEPNAAEAADDTGIPADMVEDAGGDGARGDVTGLATRLGWRPKEKYRGPEDKWLDAGDFVEKVEKEAPIKNERLRYLSEEVKKRDEQINGLKSKFDEQGALIRELLETSKAAETRGYSRAKGDIEARRKEAVANADVEAFQAAERDLVDLEKTRSPKKTTQMTDDTSTTNGAQQSKVQVDPDVDAWVGRNAWFNKDPELNGAAQKINAKLMIDRPELSVRERLDEVTRRVMEKHSDAFENSARKAPPAVGASNGNPGGPRKPKGKTEADLPADARAIMQRLVTQKVLTKEQYLKDYPWDKN